MNINYFLHGQHCVNHFLGTADGRTDSLPESETDGLPPPAWHRASPRWRGPQPLGDPPA